MSIEKISRFDPSPELVGKWVASRKTGEQIYIEDWGYEDIIEYLHPGGLWKEYCFYFHTREDLDLALDHENLSNMGIDSLPKVEKKNKEIKEAFTAGYSLNITLR